MSEQQQEHTLAATVSKSPPQTSTWVRNYVDFI